ncbi:hypothetical protein CS0771_53100 [Catellatospora sp. IY07-71]|uniref:hypothetical protein n=1 Tax=Catellatospora sp. IY07-71 TaxID=2728827 RepID=UPI001BB4077B|nr:hypothetical protein [Catellatospora sp. IY07-71]BCJ75766.1 hypothetical protein CS0771_53100 [Catellatospora sp. IY07-71]
MSAPDREDLMPDLDRHIAALCRELESGDLADIAAEIDAQPLVDRLVAALAAGGGHGTLAADFDELDRRLIAYGIAGGLVPPAHRVFVPNPAAQQPQQVTVEVWACPSARCPRWLQVADGAEPACGVDGAPMIRKQVTS